MNARKSMVAMATFLVGSISYCLPASAQGTPSAADALAAAGQQQKFAFVFFWRQQDAASDAMLQSLQSQLADYSDRVTTIHARVSDPAQQQIVNHFGVSRAPMPLVLAIAPNGAVTGAFRSPLEAEQVAGALVSPSTAACMKAMQDGKTVLLLVHPQENTQPPQGVQEFLTDASFRQRSALVYLASHDPAEADFLQQLGITQQEAGGCVVMMAPPGVLVGKFPMRVSFNDLAAELHAAGKCCDDENCRHNR